MSIEIRKLQQRDRVVVTKIFQTVIKSLGREDLFNIISSAETVGDDSGVSEEEAGAQIIKLALEIMIESIDIIDEDVGKFFASLIGVSFEEFGEQDFAVELDIIDQLIAAPEAVDFFTRCFKRAKKTEWLDNLLRKAKAVLSSISEGALESLNESNTPT